MTVRSPQEPTAAPPLSGGLDEIVLRLRALEHAMRTPVGTLAAALELLTTATDRQSAASAAEIMERQVRQLTTQLERLHDITHDITHDMTHNLGARAKGPA